MEFGESQIDDKPIENMYFLEELKHIPIAQKRGLENMMIKSSLKLIYNHLDDFKEQDKLFQQFQNFMWKLNNKEKKSGEMNFYFHKLAQMGCFKEFLDTLE